MLLLAVKEECWTGNDWSKPAYTETWDTFSVASDGIRAKLEKKVHESAQGPRTVTSYKVEFWFS